MVVGLTLQHTNRFPSVDVPEIRVRPVGATLPPEAMSQLTRAYEAGATAQALAEWYGISTSSVKTILRRLGVRKTNHATVPARLIQR